MTALHSETRKCYKRGMATDSNDPRSPHLHTADPDPVVPSSSESSAAPVSPAAPPEALASPPVRRDAPGAWRYRLTSEGVPEAFNAQTGEVAYRTLSYEELGEYECVVIDGERWWIPMGGERPVGVPGVRYSALLGDAIGQAILEGGTIREVCRRFGITYGTFCKWRRQHEDFRQAVEDAKRDRAEVYFEKMVDIVEATSADKDEVALSRLKTDVYRHMAAVGNEAFSPVNRQKIDARIGAVSVETGIRRPGDDGFVEPLDFAVIEEAQKKVVE
jgi:transposase-like protein